MLRHQRRPNRAGSSLSGSGGASFDDSATTLFLRRERYPVGGIEEVARRLVTLAERGALNPVIRQVALTATAHIHQDPDTGHPDRRDRAAIARALYDFVLAAIAYVHDPHGIEQIQSAEATLRAAAGDCDDMTVLSSALLGTLGIPTRLVTIGTNPRQPDAYTHIYAEYQSEGGPWIPFDPVIEAGVGDEVPPSQVTARREYLVGGSGAPLALATLEGATLEGATLAGTDLAGTDLAGDGDAFTQGPIAGPEAWVQITERSHSGTPPPGETFFVNVYAERIYELFGDCDLELVATGAESGEEIASSVLQLSKWTGITTCEGEGRLTFPLGFDPAETPVVLSAYDTDYFDDQLLGQSESFYLSKADVRERAGYLDEAGAGLSQVLGSVDTVLTVATVGAVGVAAFAAWPYVQAFLDERRSA